MVSARRRGVVIALSAIAVVLAALMLPATGMGSVPAGPTVTGFDSTPDGTAAHTPPPNDTPDPADATDAPGPSPTEPTPSDTPGENDTDETPGDPATPSATATPTAATGDGGGSGGDGDGPAVALVVVVLSFAAVGAMFEGKSRRWPLFRRLPVPAVSPVAAARSVPQATMAFVVRLSSSVPRLVSGLGTVAGAAAVGLSAGLRSLGRGLGALAVAVPRGLGGALLSMSGGLAGVFSGATETDRTGSDADSLDVSGFAGSAGDDDGDDGPAPTTVEGAWLAMTDRIPVQRETKTPAELARIAVDRGFPAEPVEALTETFRRVAYGGVAPTEEATARALGALDRIERRLEGDE